MRAPDADRRQPPMATPVTATPVTATPVTATPVTATATPVTATAKTAKTAKTATPVTATPVATAKTPTTAHCRASGQGHSQGRPAQRQRCLTQILLQRGMKPPSEQQQFPSEMGVMVQTKAPWRKIEDSKVLLRLGRRRGRFFIRPPR
jgi:hypothetical protein